MAPKKGKETPLELCTRATVFGNSISIRMLEYLSTTKNIPHGFRELATDFLDICRILWSIEAGLTEASKKHNSLPADMIQELDKKFRQTNDDFLVLNQMLLKFLDLEKKGGFGKLQKGWRMMFADTDIHKMRDSLANNRDALRMSALVFRWSLGDAQADASMGIGYTGLVAALERMKSTKPSVVIPATLQNPEEEQVQEAPLPATPSKMAPELPPQLPPVTLMGRSSPSTMLQRSEDFHTSPVDYSELKHFPRVPSTVSSAMTTNSARARDSVFSKEGTITGIASSDGKFSDDTMYSKQPLEERISEIDLEGRASGQAVRLKADPSSAPRWAPRQTASTNVAGLKTALRGAIEQKRHKTIEQLLDNGAPPEPWVIKEAILNRDVESIRLLLLFGGDPNGFDKDGFTPLFSTTIAAFLDGAKMLIKYGADPNLSAGPDSESPLALAVGENKFDFVQLYLMYGGDANALMANGNTVFNKAMNKITPRRLVELMLNYDTDPNVKSSEGQTPLFAAIQAGRIDLMTLLLDHGANPNLPGPKHLLWPSSYQPKALQLLLSRGADSHKAPGIMELATSINNIESISILLAAGVSPNIKKDGTYTPLCSAIRDNRPEIVTLLLENGADPNLMASEYPAFKCVTHHRVHFLPQVVAAGADLHNPKGILETAVAHNDKDALMYLLDQGVNPNDRNPQGHTALTTAIRDNHENFVDVLLANGADPGIRGQDWPICMAVKQPAILKKLLPHVSNPRAVKGVLEMAVVANQLESIKLLLKAGVSVEDKNGGVFSPLTTALREQRKDIVRFLLYEADANPNAPGEHLPIIKSIRRCPPNDTEMIEMLLDRGADVNKMYRGWSAVLQAVENGDGRILKLLIEKGNGIDLQTIDDESGRPVIELVTERGWDEAVTLLVGSHNANNETVGIADGGDMRRRQ